MGQGFWKGKILQNCGQHVLEFEKILQWVMGFCWDGKILQNCGKHVLELKEKL